MVKHILQREGCQSDEDRAIQEHSFLNAIGIEIEVLQGMMLAEEDTGVHQWVLPVEAVVTLFDSPAFVMPRGGQM